MKDSQLWIYIIIGVIYGISWLFKKLAKPQDETATPPAKPQSTVDNPRPSSQPRPLTFEELLQEITEGKQSKPVALPSQPRQEYVDYDDDLEEEEQDLERVDQDYRKEKVYEVYEEAKRQAFQKASLEETMNVRDTVVTFGKFKVFEQDKQRNLLDEYTRDFRDPEGFKKAFVMSEILKTKF